MMQSQQPTLSSRFQRLYTSVNDVFASRSWLRMLAIAVFFLVATVVMTWPLTIHAHEAVQDVGDPLFEIWVMRAVQHQLVTDPLNLYDTNIFYPFEYTLAYSEEAISSALLAWPVYLISGNQVLAYNWLVLSSFWLMGFAVYLLAREIGASPGAALVAGMIAAFFPGRYAHLSHLHLLVFGWLPLTLWAVLRFHRSGERRYAVIAGVALAIQLLASLHLAVFSSLAIGIFIVMALIGERKRLPDLRKALTLAVALVIPYLLLFPTLLPHLWAGERYGFDRTRDEVARFAAEPQQYWSVFVSNDVLSHWLPVRASAFFPGFVAVVGVLLAFVVVRRWSWPVLFCAVLTVVAGVFSLGFDIEIGGRSIPLPYRAVYDLIPPMRDVRGVDRFGLLTGIGVAVLAAVGYSYVWRWVRPRFGQWTTVAAVVLTVVLTLTVGAGLRSGVGVAAAPDDPQRIEVYDWLRGQPDGPVVEFPSGGLLEGPFQPIEYMYYSTFHWKPILAGYSGYAPPAHITMMQYLQGDGDVPSMPTQATVGILQDLGVRYVIVHRWDTYDWQQAVQSADSLPELERLVDIGDSVIYGLEEGTRLAPTIEIAPVAQEIGAGAHFSAPIRITNANPNAAIAWLDGTGMFPVQVAWTNETTGEVIETQANVAIPAIVLPGDTVASVLVTAPDAAGAYELGIQVDGELTASSTQRIAVVEPAELDTARAGDAPLALAAVNPTVAAQSGSATLPVDVTWFSLNQTEQNLTATLQLFDDQGNRVSQLDMQLQGGAGGGTASWLPGDQVLTRFVLPLGDGLASGDYDLLIAVYDPNQPDLARALMLLPEGDVSTEWWLRGIQIP